MPDTIYLQHTIIDTFSLDTIANKISVIEIYYI
jgi:hypothetical protein